MLSKYLAGALVLLLLVVWLMYNRMEYLADKRAAAEERAVYLEGELARQVEQLEVLRAQYAALDAALVERESSLAVLERRLKDLHRTVGEAIREAGGIVQRCAAVVLPRVVVDGLRAPAPGAHRGDEGGVRGPAESPPP